jgi:hypothetical protein
MWACVCYDGQQAIQLHVAYSQTFIGMGAIAGGPYFCTRSHHFLLTYCCTAHAWLQVRWTTP